MSTQGHQDSPCVSLSLSHNRSRDHTNALSQKCWGRVNNISASRIINNHFSFHLFIFLFLPWCLVTLLWNNRFYVTKQTNMKSQIANMCLGFNVHSVLDCNLNNHFWTSMFFTIIFMVFWYLECRHSVISKTDYVAFPHRVTLNLHEEKHIKKTALVKVEGKPLTMWQVGSSWKQTDRVRCTYRV